MFKKANRVTRLDKALILGFMAGYRDNPRPNPDNILRIKLNESKVSIFLLIFTSIRLFKCVFSFSQELVKQPDESFAVMIVDTLIQLDYNTGEWKTFRTIRKGDQQVQAQQQNDTVQANASATSSVVI